MYMYKLFEIIYEFCAWLLLRTHTRITVGSYDQQCQMSAMLLAGDSSTSNLKPETTHGPSPDMTEVGTRIMILNVVNLVSNWECCSHHFHQITSPLYWSTLCSPEVMWPHSNITHHCHALCYYFGVISCSPCSEDVQSSVSKFYTN